MQKKNKKLETQAKDINPKSYLQMKSEFEDFMEESEWQSEFIKEFATSQVDELINYIRKDFKKWEQLDDLDEEMDQFLLDEISENPLISKIIPMCYAAEKDRRFLLETFNDFLLHITDE